MPNTAGLPTTSGYRVAAMSAVYPAAGLMAALFLATASKGPSDATYNNTGEVATGGGYTQGGVAVDSSTPPSQSGSTTIFTPAADILITNLTTGGAVDCIQMYDSGDANAVRGTFTFGSTSLTAGELLLKMPVNDASNALARWNWS